MEREQVVGGLYATAAFGAWGLVPAYWKQVAFVPGPEMVAHRVLWALPVLLVLFARRHALGRLRGALAHSGHRRLLTITALLVGSNWLVFIWAVQEGHLLEASLGYYINPLVNVLLGRVFLGERLTRRQGVAVGVAAVGVAALTVGLGVVPFVALGLALTFGAYGLLRKQAGVDALTGLGVEVCLLAPLAVAGIGVFAAGGDARATAQGLGGIALVACSGPVTVLPLLWFAEGARRLRYSTLGFFQYLAPTGQFLLAVLAYGEAFTRSHAVAFPLIWLAVLLYLSDARRGARVIAGSPVPGR